MNLLFDLDGTLTDPGVGFVRCVQHAFHGLSLPLPPAPEILRHVGPPLRDTLHVLLGPHGSRTEEAVALYRQRYESEGIWETALYPGIEDAIAGLRGISALYVVTSKATRFAVEIVNSWPFASAFRGVHGSELDGRLADKRQLVAHVLQQERIVPDSAFMIGDRAQDMVGARHNGVKGIGISWGYGSAEELTLAGASVVLDSPAALVDYFKAQSL